MFDAAAFLTQTQVADKLETQFSPIPAREYIGMITKFEAKQQPNKENTGMYTIVDVFIAIDDAAAKEATGMANPVVRDSMFLDIGPDGKLETGKNKNIALGRYLEACGVNGQPGNPWQLMQGKMVKVQVTVDPDKNDPKKLWNRVKAVGRAM